MSENIHFQKGETAMFHDLTNEAYHHGPEWGGYLSASALKVLIQKTPKHFKHYLENPIGTTKAMEIGTAVHTAVLEPEFFPVYVAAAPECDRRTTEGKVAYANFQALNGEKIILKQDEFDSVHAMAAAVHASDTATRLLDKMPTREKSIKWYDKTFQTHCKARPDMFGMNVLSDGQNLICDLKTHNGKKKFQYAAMDYNYPVQAGWYRRGMKAVTGKDWEFGFIVVEKDAPHCVSFYIMPPDRNILIDDAIERAGNIFAECQRTDDWPGYPEEFQELELTPGVENLLAKYCEEG